MSKIIIVDDHILFRLGIRAAIEESFADISIIAECSSAHELLIHLKNGTKPDLILLDIMNTRNRRNRDSKNHFARLPRY